MPATATAKNTATAAKPAARKRTASKAAPAPTAPANAAPVAPAPTAPVTQSRAMVKANKFAQLAKDNGYTVSVTKDGESGATVTADRGRESVTFVWVANKLQVKPLPEWKWSNEAGDTVVSTLVVHNVGEFRRIAVQEGADMTPELAAKVRFDATITGTNRVKVAETATASK